MNSTKQVFEQKKVLILIAVLCAFFIGTDSMVVSPLIPVILDSTNTPIERGGLLISFYALFYGLSAPFFGPMSDRVGRKKMIVTGLFIFSAGTFLTGAFDNFTNVLFFRSVTGMAGALVMPSIFAMVGDYFSIKERGKAIGLVMGAMIGSTVIGVPLGALLTSMSNWQSVFLCLGLSAFILSVFTLYFFPEDLEQTDSTLSPLKLYSKNFKTAFRNPSVLFALSATFLWTIGLHALFSYIGVFYSQTFNLRTDEIGMILLGAGVASVLGNIIGGKWSDRFGKNNVVFIAGFVCAVFVLLLSFQEEYLSMAVLLHVLWSASVGMGQSSLTTLHSQLSPSVRGTVMSLNSSAMYIGMTVASAISSLLLGNYSFIAIGIVSAVSALLILPVIRRVKTDEFEKDSLQMKVKHKRLNAEEKRYSKL